MQFGNTGLPTFGSTDSLDFLRHLFRAGGTLYAELLTMAKHAKLQFIVTSATLEEDTASKRADDLREILITRLRLHPDSGASGKHEEKCNSGIA